MAQPSLTMRENLIRIADELPPDASWEDVLDIVRVNAAISRGFRDLEEGKSYTHDEVKRILGVSDEDLCE